MAPAASPPKSRKGLQARLTAKVGPLPVWLWAVAILGAYLLYAHLHPSSGSPAPDSSTAVSAGDSTTGGAQVPSSGQGTPADNLSSGLLDAIGANTSAADALTSQILNYAPLPDPAVGSGDLFGLGDYTQSQQPSSAPGPGPAASPTPPASTVAAVAQPHQTQTSAGILSWDGLQFTSRSAFDRWASAHGTSSAAIFRTHPAAKNLYGTLKP